MALPQPNVLNLTSWILCDWGSTLIWSFITSPPAAVLVSTRYQPALGSSTSSIKREVGLWSRTYMQGLRQGQCRHRYRPCSWIRHCVDSCSVCVSPMRRETEANTHS